MGMLYLCIGNGSPQKCDFAGISSKRERVGMLQNRGASIQYISLPLGPPIPHLCPHYILPQVFKCNCPMMYSQIIYGISIAQQKPLFSKYYSIRLTGLSYSFCLHIHDSAGMVVAMVVAALEFVEGNQKLIFYFFLLKKKNYYLKLTFITIV